MSRGGVAWLVLSLAGFLGCGGRYERNAPTSDVVGPSGGSSTSPSAESGSVGLVGGTGGGVGGTGGGVGAAPSSAGAPSDVCVQQFFDYGDYRTQVEAEFSSFGCKIDDDCLAFYDQSSCDPGCVLVITGARRGVIDRLNNYETSSCDPSCSPLPWMSCPTATPARCVAGRCL